MTKICPTKPDVESTWRLAYPEAGPLVRQMRERGRRPASGDCIVLGALRPPAGRSFTNGVLMTLVRIYAYPPDDKAVIRVRG